MIGDNSGDKLQLFVEQLVYIKAADNYCEVVFLDGGIQKRLLRSSLSALLAQIPPETNNIYRCHRSYAINLSAIKSYSGNSAGLKIETNIEDVTVPVSRSYVNQIKQALQITP